MPSLLTIAHNCSISYNKNTNRIQYKSVLCLENEMTNTVKAAHPKLTFDARITAAFRVTASKYVVIVNGFFQVSSIVISTGIPTRFWEVAATAAAASTPALARRARAPELSAYSIRRKRRKNGDIAPFSPHFNWMN